MTTRNLFRTMFLTLIALAIAFPMAAASKRRAVKPPSIDPRLTVTLSGTVVDAASGAPVVAADVFSANLNLYTTTNATGSFTLTVPANMQVTLEISRVGYETLQTTVSIGTNASQRFTLVGRQTVHVRMTNGATYELDGETLKFGFLTGPFGTYITDTRMSLCKPGGSSFTPDRVAIRKITGPASPRSHAPCCANPILGLTIEMKSGETTEAYLTDTCFGGSVEVIALQHTKVDAVFLPMANIASIEFP